ncbi:MAG: rod shape-determining protein [SAR324 cluster bacterium]|nr:rod shape-determining protein [SAR324 cluster bacterium]
MNKDSSNQLRIGIELGTSKTAVQSNRGAKAMFPSVVGYPKDLIGAQLLNGTKAIGEEALSKQSSLDIHYPLEAGVIKATEMDSARLILEHAVKLAQPGEHDDISLVIGVPARTSFNHKEDLLKLARDLAGTTLVVSEPFMVAYGLGKLNHAIVIDIGAGTTDICVLTGKIPEDEEQLTIAQGGDYIDHILKKLISEHFPEVQISKKQVQSIKEQHAFVGKPEKSVIVTLRVAGKPQQFDLTREIRTACETLIEPILDCMETLLQRIDPEDQDDTLNNIYLSGRCSRIKGLDKVLQEHLRDYGSVYVTGVEDPDFAGCHGALKIAMEVPVENWNELGEVIEGGVNA